MDAVKTGRYIGPKIKEPSKADLRVTRPIRNTNETFGLF